jgi:hypothetical protein
MAGLCFTSGDIADACVLACAQHSNNPQLAAPLVNENSTVAKHPAWTAKKRPASAVQQLEMQWQLPLEQLKTTVEQHLLAASADALVLSSEHLWQGQCFEMFTTLFSHSTDEPCLILCICRTMEGSVASVHNVTFKLSVVSAPGRNQQQQPASTSPSQILTGGSGRRFWGQLQVIKLGNVSSWAAAQTKMRELGLVHADGCLHIKGLVTSIE